MGPEIICEPSEVVINTGSSENDNSDVQIVRIRSRFGRAIDEVTFDPTCDCHAVKIDKTSEWQVSVSPGRGSLASLSECRFHATLGEETIEGSFLIVRK